MKEISKPQNFSDLELLEHLCLTNEDSFYNEFVKRFYGCVTEECKLKCRKQKLDFHVGKEIAHKTFENVRKYRSFKMERSNHVDPKKAIISWLFRISTNLFYDHHNITKKAETPIPAFSFLAVNSEIETDPKKLHTIRENASLIFNKLTENEKTVILADIEHKRGRKYLPEDITDSLCERMKVGKDAIRKIRERAINKIKQAIDEINK